MNNSSSLKQYILEVPNFPIHGVGFKDITPLLRDHLPETLEQLGSKINWDEIDLVAGIESRGFILGTALATRYGKGFVPIRKKGKLPPPIISHQYQLEYGSDTLEIKENNHPYRVLLVDDVLATGGTLQASATLCEQAKYVVKDLLVLIDLKFLNNFEWKGKSCKSVIAYH